jgi:hypothetical protein
MLSQLVNHFEKSNLFDNEQHGYRKNKSSITALISYIENILKKLDKDNHIIGAVLDISKAVGNPIK